LWLTAEEPMVTMLVPVNATASLWVGTSFPAWFVKAMVYVPAGRDASE
jgi:hypothetical protein